MRETWNLVQAAQWQIIANINSAVAIIGLWAMVIGIAVDAGVAALALIGLTVILNLGFAAVGFKWSKDHRKQAYPFVTQQ